MNDMAEGILKAMELGEEIERLKKKYDKNEIRWQNIYTRQSCEDYALLEAFRTELGWDAVAEKMREYGYDPDDCQLSDVMVAVRKIMWRIIGKHRPNYEIGVPVSEVQCSDCDEMVTDLQAHCEREDNICLIHRPVSEEPDCDHSWRECVMCSKCDEIMVAETASEEQKEIPHDRGSNQYANPDDE